MTTATAASPPSLDERLADAEKELLVAQAVLGNAVAAGTDQKPAAKRVADIRATVEALRLGQAAEARKAEDTAYEEIERREAIARWKYLAWCAEYIERMAPVLKLRAELRKAEEHVMALDDLLPILRKDNQWIAIETEAGRLEPINLPKTATVVMRVHRMSQHCNGEEARAEDGELTLEELASWAKKLPPLVEQAAKPLGKDASREQLPWNGG